MDQKEYLKQFISDFVTQPGNANVDALLSSLADEAQRLEDMSVAVTDNLTISTSSGIYADKRLAEVGITRPSELGMDDLAFIQMGIQVNAAKQITESLHAVLSTFYGDETVRASTTSGQPEPYALEDRDDLIFALEDGTTRTLSIDAAAFANVGQASAAEMSDVITRFVRSLGYDSYAQVYLNVDTGQKYVQFFGGAKGPYGFIQILGGRVQNQLEFPSIRQTQLPLNTTVWEITRNIGDTYRFRWASGPQPKLDLVFISDKVMIYGQDFNSVGIGGTFDVTAVRPAEGIPAYDSGFFEVSLPNFTALKSSLPNVAPPPNSPGNTYSLTVTQGSFDDLKFFLPKKNTSYSQPRYALAWEPANSKLKIYMPATTKVVKRDLIGSAHLHLKYPATELNGAFGSATVIDDQVIITSDRGLKYRQRGYDIDGQGGTVQYGLTTVPIDYAFRENGFTSIICAQPHGLTGTTDAFGITRTTQLITVIMGSVQQDDQANSFLGPYMVDPAAPYSLTDQFVTTREPIIAGEGRSSLLVSGALPNQEGILLIGLNTDEEEGPVKYFASQSSSAATPIAISTISQLGNTVTVVTTGPHGVIANQQILVGGTLNFNGTWTVASAPSGNVLTFNRSPAATLFEAAGTVTPIINGAVSTLILDPSYIFKFNHATGIDVNQISSQQAYTPEPDGSDYGAYVTGTANGRTFAQQLMQDITAAGINLEIIIIYPSDEGLGNAGLSEAVGASPQSDAVFVWGE